MSTILKIRTLSLWPALLLALALPLHADSGITVVAHVGNDIITSEDVSEAVQPVADAMSPEERASAEGQQKLADARKNVLDNMIEQKLVILAAKDGPEGYADAAKDNKTLKNPYLPGESDVETEMEKIFDQTRQRFNDEDDFEAALAKEHLSVPEYRDRLRQRVRDEMTFDRMQKIKEQE
ncbi:MAG: SurA N-terminal domain-containing protein, partial [bacterium]